MGEGGEQEVEQTIGFHQQAGKDHRLLYTGVQSRAFTTWEMNSGVKPQDSESETRDRLGVTHPHGIMSSLTSESPGLSSSEEITQWLSKVTISDCRTDQDGRLLGIEVVVGDMHLSGDFEGEEEEQTYLLQFAQEICRSLLPKSGLTPQEQALLQDSLRAVDLNSIVLPTTSSLKQQLQTAITSILAVAQQQGRLSPPSEHRLFEDKGQPEIVAMASAMVMVSSTRCQLRTDQWGVDDNGLAVFVHQSRTNQQNYVQHFISSPGDIGLLPWEQAEQIIHRFGFNTVKLQFILAAHTMNQINPWQSQFSLKASDIIKDLGWDKRTDISKAQKLLEVAKAAFSLDCILVKSVWVEGRHSKGGLDVSIPISRMWNIKITSQGQMNTQGEVEEPEEVILDIRPGLWTEDCLNKAGNEARQALYQFGYLARDVLRIDAYRNELALRLAIHLTLESRFHPTGLYQVKTLLEAIQPQQVIEEACEDREKRRSLKQKWDAALDLLQELGWQVSFDDSYLPEWQPGAKQSSRSGYFRDLLNAKILIRPPEPIPQLIQRASTAKGLRGSTSASLLLPRQQQARITPDEIKKARQKHKITQAELGKHLGTTKGWISHIENQRKTLTQDKAREMLAAIEYLSAGKGKR